MNKIEEQIFLNEMHSKIDLNLHLQILHKDKNIGDLNFLDLMFQCFSQTGTGSQPFKLIRRSERLLNLLSFLIYATENSDGNIVECGVFKGFSALAMKRVLLNLNRENTLYLLDSFEGLSEPVDEDSVSNNGPAMLKGHFATPVELVENIFINYANVNIVKGWIPDSFEYLPDVKWSFVHLDVDLYRPINDCLEYFYPRLNSGGVILNDDYNSALFPGAGIAWRKFFELKKESFLILDSGQAVFIKK
jgi:O-methyltransferase